MGKFNYLVRFKDDLGRFQYGEAGETGGLSELVGKTVNVYSGNFPWDDDFKLSGSQAKIVEVGLRAPDSIWDD